MSEIPMIHTWKGQDINELSREELLEVVTFLAGEYAKHTSPEAIRARAIGSAKMLVDGDHGFAKVS